MAPSPAGALLIAASKQRKLVENEFALAQVGEWQHRNLLRRCLLIVGGNREFGATRIEVNDAVVPSFSTMRRCVFFGQEEWARLVFCRRRRATGKHKQDCYKTGNTVIRTQNRVISRPSHLFRSQSSYSILQAPYTSYKSCTLDKIGPELSRLFIEKADIAATPMDGWGN